MSNAANLVTATLKTVQCFWSADEWVKMYKHVNKVASCFE